METTRIKVTGMTCNHCVERVTKAVQGVKGVSEAVVSLEHGSAVIRHDGAILLEITKAIETAGYTATFDT